MASPGRDLKKLRQSSTAVASELHDFLSRMEGKSPREVLGTIATSGLGRSLVTATFAFAVLTAVFTVGPYFWGMLIDGGDETEIAAQEETTPAAAQAAGAKPAQPAEGQPAATQADAAGVNLNKGNGEEIIDKLGVGDTVTAPLNVNPLESATDDLLEGLD